jgi:hypothetical protein
VSVVPAGAGRLQVTLVAVRSSLLTANAVRTVQLGTLQNAVVDVPSQSSVAAAQTGLGSGATVSLSGPVQSIQLTVRRVAPGAFTAPLTLTDDCGPWQTIAGGGAADP